MIRLSVDIGGTFTDIVLEKDGLMATHKVLSTPSSPEVGAMNGIAQILLENETELNEIRSVIHGTTLATNALIERKGAKVAFVTTAGFRDVLEMRNEKRFDQYDLGIKLPEPLVPRQLRLPLRERVLADGSVLCAPDEEQIGQLASAIEAADVEAVAIGLLHSYANPTHEVITGKRLAEVLSDHITICLSSEVSPEAREYDRFSTVCANAYVRPLMARYLTSFNQRLKEGGFSGSFLMMLSGGGVTTLEQATRSPIRLVESGPAGGVALAAYIAKEVGSNRTLALDLGGTTAKICFLQDGIPQTTRRFEVARAWQDVKGSGLPVRVPTIEMVEIGAGGGSIATVDGLSRLTVGPHSAGASPGPCSYQLGGKDATLTDAHVTLKNIDPEGFAGGSIELNPQCAEEAIQEQIAQPLGLQSLQIAAAGIIEMSDEIMANAARVHGLELGKDISEFDLIVSGGGGALHATRIAEKLSIGRIFVPENAGVGSAVGFLHAPISFEIAKSIMRPISALDTSSLAQEFRNVKEEILSIVSAIANAGNIQISASAELRYAGQGQEVKLDIDLNRSVAQTLDELQERFHKAYERMYGFTMQELDIEFFSFSVCATAPVQSYQTDGSDQANQCVTMRTNQRDIFDLEKDEFVAFNAIHRVELPLGKTIVGPAVIIEDQTTTMVRKGWSVQRLDSGHLMLERSAL
ncbi:MAG: hydantoinase/oxoprolinase family protein [Hyphomicrobiales bacterium]